MTKRETFTCYPQPDGGYTIRTSGRLVATVPAGSTARQDAELLAAAPLFADIVRRGLDTGELTLDDIADARGALGKITNPRPR